MKLNTLKARALEANAITLEESFTLTSDEIQQKYNRQKNRMKGKRQKKVIFIKRANSFKEIYNKDIYIKVPREIMESDMPEKNKINASIFYNLLLDYSFRFKAGLHKAKLLTDSNCPDHLKRFIGSYITDVNMMLLESFFTSYKTPFVKQEPPVIFQKNLKGPRFDLYNTGLIQWIEPVVFEPLIKRVIKPMQIVLKPCEDWVLMKVDPHIHKNWCLLQLFEKPEQERVLNFIAMTGFKPRWVNATKVYYLAKADVTSIIKNWINPLSDSDSDTNFSKIKAIYDKLHQVNEISFNSIDLLSRVYSPFSLLKKNTKEWVNFRKEHDLVEIDASCCMLSILHKSYLNDISNSVNYYAQDDILDWIDSTDSKSVNLINSWSCFDIPKPIIKTIANKLFNNINQIKELLYNNEFSYTGVWKFTKACKAKFIKSYSQNMWDDLVTNFNYYLNKIKETVSIPFLYWILDKKAFDIYEPVESAILNNTWALIENKAIRLHDALWVNSEEAPKALELLNKFSKEANMEHLQWNLNTSKSDKTDLENDPRTWVSEKKYFFINQATNLFNEYTDPSPKWGNRFYTHIDDRIDAYLAHLIN